MLHDILLQKKFYKLKMLLKNNVTNTVCYRKKMKITDIMIQLQKVSYLLYLKYIQECYSPCRFPGVLLVKNSPG